MNIIIISPEKFDSHMVSKHHYAITLSKKGHSVFFLNPPVDDVKLEIKRTDVNNLYLISSKKIIKGLRFFPAFFIKYLEKKWLHTLEKKIGKKIDLIWLFENSRFFDMRFAENRMKIYHQVDLNQNFYPKIAASTADVCFCVTDFIKNFLSIFNDKVYKINHGLPVYKELTLTDVQHHEFKKKHINAVYVGNMDIPYIDMDIIIKIVEKFNDIQFHFIGGCENNILFFNLLNRSLNVTWWGKIDYKLIYSINKKADILLVAYQSEKYKKQVADSHKIMEYLSSGKVIVATYTDEYKDKRQLLEMADSSSEYINIFERVVNNLSEYNSQERQLMRKAFAESNTYDKQIDKIFSLLKRHNLLPDN